jgi:hypothetical protein
MRSRLSFNWSKNPPDLYVLYDAQIFSVAFIRERQWTKSWSSHCNTVHTPLISLRSIIILPSDTAGPNLLDVPFPLRCLHHYYTSITLPRPSPTHPLTSTSSTSSHSYHFLRSTNNDSPHYVSFAILLLGPNILLTTLFWRFIFWGCILSCTVNN